MWEGNWETGMWGLKMGKGNWCIWDIHNLFFSPEVEMWHHSNSRLQCPMGGVTSSFHIFNDIYIWQMAQNLCTYPLDQNRIKGFWPICHTVMVLTRGGEYEPKVGNQNQTKFQVLLREVKGDNKKWGLYCYGTKIKINTLEGGNRWQEKVRIIYFWNRNNPQFYDVIFYLFLNKTTHFQVVFFLLLQCGFFMKVPKNVILNLCYELSRPSNGFFLVPKKYNPHFFVVTFHFPEE